MHPVRPQYISATCETHRNVGPRGIHGCVTLEFERAPVFQFSSGAIWPASDNFDGAIERAVEEVLQQTSLSHPLACRLLAVRWHPIDSCESGFIFAARMAARSVVDSLGADDAVSGFVGSFEGKLNQSLCYKDALDWSAKI